MNARVVLVYLSAVIVGAILLFIGIARDSIPAVILAILVFAASPLVAAFGAGR